MKKCGKFHENFHEKVRKLSRKSADPLRCRRARKGGAGNASPLRAQALPYRLRWSFPLMSSPRVLPTGPRGEAKPSPRVRPIRPCRVAPPSGDHLSIVISVPSQKSKDFSSWGLEFSGVFRKKLLSTEPHGGLDP